MKSKDVTVMIILLYIIMQNSLSAAAQEEQQPFLRFATSFTKQRMLSNIEELPSTFSSEAAWTLALNGKLIMLYQRPHVNARLSFFTKGQEQVLWDYQGYMSLTGPARPPVLAEGFLNANETPDILFCYTDDKGIGQGAEVWDQYLLLFLDGTQQTSPLRLSASDWWTDDKPPYMKGNDGQEASERETEVLLLPAHGTRPCTVILWSCIETYDYPPTNTPHSIIYTIETYQLDGVQFIMTTTETGTSVSTAQTLRTLIEAERAAGTPPILLDFNQRPTDYLASDDDWFAWERIGD